MSSFIMLNSLFAEYKQVGLLAVPTTMPMPRTEIAALIHLAAYNTAGSLRNREHIRSYILLHSLFMNCLDDDTIGIVWEYAHYHSSESHAFDIDRSGVVTGYVFHPNLTVELSSTGAELALVTKMIHKLTDFKITQRRLWLNITHRRLWRKITRNETIVKLHIDAVVQKQKKQDHKSEIKRTSAWCLYCANRRCSTRCPTRHPTKDWLLAQLLWLDRIMPRVKDMRYCPAMRYCVRGHIPIDYFPRQRGRGRGRGKFACVLMTSAVCMRLHAKFHSQYRRLGGTSEVQRLKAN